MYLLLISQLGVEVAHNTHILFGILLYIPLQLLIFSIFFFSLRRAPLPLSGYKLLFISFYFVSLLPNLLNLNQWEFDDTTEHVSNFWLLCQNRLLMAVFYWYSPFIYLYCDITVCLDAWTNKLFFKVFSLHGILFF